MKLSAKDYRAIGWYVKAHNLRPALSTPPKMFFVHKETGEQTTADLSAIVNDYNHQIEEDKRVRARKIKQLEKWTNKLV